MSGAYQGAKEGSALNNFVLRMSLVPDAMGIVLLDEIEKANQSVIHALYQVIDKGEWTNKRLSGKGAQTSIIPCHNLVFVMTTNAADFQIMEFVNEKKDSIYTSVSDEFEELGTDLSTRIRNILQFNYPFTEAFIGRVGRIIPFLPMANGDHDAQHPLLGEMMTVAKFLIERQQDKFSHSNSTRVQQWITAKTKHRMAKIVLRQSIQEAGVRSIQQAVEAHMGNRMVDSLLLEQVASKKDRMCNTLPRKKSARLTFVSRILMSPIVKKLLTKRKKVRKIWRFMDSSIVNEYQF
jgi:ATP-dependent Clp protease ATP-binding subunit ClpA